MMVWCDALNSQRQDISPEIIVCTICNWTVLMLGVIGFLDRYVVQLLAVGMLFHDHDSEL